MTVRGAHDFVVVIGWALLPLGLLSLLRSLLVIGLARRHVRLSAARIEGPRWFPPVTVLVPAYNEAVVIERAKHALVASDYPELEVVVLDDGSTDGTGDLVEALGLPNVRLVRQPNGGKAAALAIGTKQASHDILVMLDGDTIFETDTIRHLVQSLRDPRVGAVSGNTKVGNRTGLLGRWQHLEYVSGFNLDYWLLDLLSCITTVPRAAGAFRRQALVAAGGISTDTLARTSTSRWPSCGPATPSSTKSAHVPGRRRRAPSRTCGGSAGGGATARCSASGSTGGRCARRAPSGGPGCRTSSPSRYCFRVQRR